MTEYFKIGKFVSAFGLKGELILKHHLGRRTTLKGVQALFVEEGKERFLPWFVQHTRSKSADELYVQLTDVTTREAAVKLAQKEVWVTEADFKSRSAKRAPISLLGFEVVEGSKTLGSILEVIEQPHQVLCRIQIEGKDVLIPLHEGTLLRVDNKARRVSVQLPEGLLEIYL